MMPIFECDGFIQRLSMVFLRLYAIFNFFFNKNRETFKSLTLSNEGETNLLAKKNFDEKPREIGHLQNELDKVIAKVKDTPSKIKEHLNEFGKMLNQGENATQISRLRNGFDKLLEERFEMYAIEMGSLMEIWKRIL